LALRRLRAKPCCSADPRDRSAYRAQIRGTSNPQRAGQLERPAEAVATSGRFRALISRILRQEKSVQRVAQEEDDMATTTQGERVVGILRPSISGALEIDRASVRVRLRSEVMRQPWRLDRFFVQCDEPYHPLEFLRPGSPVTKLRDMHSSTARPIVEQSGRKRFRSSLYLSAPDTNRAPDLNLSPLRSSLRMRSKPT
jgi:hypothetical protein